MADVNVVNPPVSNPPVSNPPVSNPPVPQAPAVPPVANQQGSVPQVVSKPATSAGWLVVLNIILFISLYIFAAAISIIFHIWIERVLPNEISIFTLFKQSQNYLMTASLAAIFVSFPLFTKLAVKLKKQATQDPSTKNLPVRVVLSYLTLVLTFLLIAAHTIFVMYEFLSGSGNLNTASHLLSTFLVAGSIFIYLIHEKVTANSKDVLFFIFMTVLGVIAIVYALSAIPSPLEQQKVKQDQQKIGKIKNLHTLVSQYYLKNKKLPDASFVETQRLEGVDGYTIIGPASYKVCSLFESDSVAVKKKSAEPVYDKFDHPKGEHCFNLTVEKEYHPATAELVSVKRFGRCGWEVAMELDNFNPLSPLTVNSKGRVADKCNANDFVDYSWTAQGMSIEEDGKAVIKYNHGDYGKYTYTFTDNKGKKASVTVEYSLDSVPLASASPTLLR